MRLDETINVGSLPESDRSYEPLPAGWYSARIHSAEIKPTKVPGGQYIKVRYDIVGPSHQGRVIFGNLNIRNANPKAEQIGRQQLGELMRAIGLTEIQDTDQLVGGQCQIKVAIQAAADGYEPSNEVKGWKHNGGATAPSAPAKAAASTTKTPPWKR